MLIVLKMFISKEVSCNLKRVISCHLLKVTYIITIVNRLRVLSQNKLIPNQGLRELCMDTQFSDLIFTGKLFNEIFFTINRSETIATFIVFISSN